MTAVQASTNTPAGTLSYSSGTGELDPYAWRMVGPGGQQFAAAARLSPIIADTLAQDPIVISCYPGSLGHFDGVTFVDTYLRVATFLRAMELAAQERRPVVIIGQPLCAADFIQRYVSSFETRPSAVVVALGGYHCPASLERFIRHSLHGVEHEVVHGYGVAEVEFACLIGLRGGGDDIHYSLASTRVELRRGDGNRLLLRRADADEIVDTGDTIEALNQACEPPTYRIVNGEARLAASVLSLLNEWSCDDWRRRTGLLLRRDGAIVSQLRFGQTPEYANEMRYQDFLGLTTSSWLNKPGWDSNLERIV